MGFEYTYSVNGNKQRITQAEKDANDKQWYKDQANLLDGRSFSNAATFTDFAGVTDFKRKQTNYNLFNNIVDIRDLTYVCKPYWKNGPAGDAGIGELPANFTNRDIVSGKIKVLLGMEMKMPFSWRVFAVNEDATTRREQEEFGRIKQFVTAEVMKPIKEMIELQHQEEIKGRKLTPAEQQQVQEQIASEMKAQTPDEVRKYMTREHQDPAEALSRQLLEYLTTDKKINHKFNKGWKHSNISGEEIYWVGSIAGEPDVEVVNPLLFDYDKSPDVDFIEDGEWAVREIRMTPSMVITNFGRKLKNHEIDKIYTYHSSPDRISDRDFTFTEDSMDDPFTIRVLHCTWKSLRKIGFLTYLSRTTGKYEEMIVDENYRLNKHQGDKKIEWTWIPETHEVYKIMDDIFCYARPIPGQHKDLDNLYKCKLPYYGAACDSLNSVTTAPMDRMKSYQYLYDVIIYRMELALASDKGKKMIANINAVPKSAGIDIHKWSYFFEANGIGWLNPMEEGNKAAGDITNMVKEIDMSMISDIEKYIKIAEYIKAQCGYAIGVTPQMEAQIAAGEAVSNTRQNLVQSSYIIQPYFELHNTVKGNVLEALLEQAKVTYSVGKPRKLAYILDDMSLQLLNVDQDLLSNSSYGLFVSNSTKAAEAKQAVESLAQAAIQNQQANLLDIVKIIKAESINEAEELLEVAQMRESDRLKEIEEMKQKTAEKIEAARQEEVLAEREHEIRLARVKEEEKRETAITVQEIESLGFNENKDVNQNRVPDVLEVAKHTLDTTVKMGKQAIDQQKLSLQERELQHREQVDREKLEIDRKKLNKPSSSK